MKMQPVASSNIRSIGFENGELRIEFANGRVYAYTGPKVEQHYQGIMSGPSVGKYFAAHIRNCPDTICRLIEPDPAPITDADVPY